MTVFSPPFLFLIYFFSSNCIALSVTTSSVMAGSSANGCSDFSGGALVSYFSVSHLLYVFGWHPS